MAAPGGPSLANFANALIMLDAEAEFHTRLLHELIEKRSVSADRATWVFRCCECTVVAICQKCHNMMHCCIAERILRGGGGLRRTLHVMCVTARHFSLERLARLAFG